MVMAPLLVPVFLLSSVVAAAAGGAVVGCCSENRKEVKKAAIRTSHPGSTGSVRADGDERLV
jgi:hypothetical protein